MSILANILGGTVGTFTGIGPVAGAKATNVAYKGLKAAQGFLNKIIGKKKDKQARKAAEAQAKIAQLQTFQSYGTANTGTDFKSTPAQVAAMGVQPSEALTPLPSQIMSQNQNSNFMDWLKANWYYVAGGAAVLYFLMGRKKRR